MKRDISENAFESLSKEKKKQYIAKLVIKSSKASPVDAEGQPAAIIMAGLPGAGKTEFLDTVDELLESIKHPNYFVRIDLDQIITVYPKYKPQSYEKFRSQANYALARCIDLGRKERYNMMIDGTFGGNSGASVNNIERLLNGGYRIELVFMYDEPETAWQYTLKRRIETQRSIDKEDFIKSCQNIPNNLKLAIDKFRNHPSCYFNMVVQKELRDKDYILFTDIREIDKIAKSGYDIDKFKKLL